MTTPNIPKTCVDTMMHNDAFSQWLGIKIITVSKGYVKASMQVRLEMLNGFKTVQGGVLFAFADSVFAFSCNTHNNLSVALNCTISYPKPSVMGDILFAEAKELDLTNKTGCYEVTVSNQKKEVVARFRGIPYRTGKPLITKDEVRKI